MQRVATVAAVIAAVGLAWGLGLFDLLGDRDRMVALLEEMGPAAYVVYVLSFALLEPLFVPGVLFLLPASVVWPAWLAILLSWIGAVGAGIVGFTLARTTARDWVAARIPPRFRRFDEALERKGLQAVILIRLTTFLAPPAHYVLGLSKVSFPVFVLGSAIGFLPGTAAWILLGASIADGKVPAAVWIALGAVALGIWWWRRRRTVPEPGSG